jgi:CHAT domain-containing protein
LAEAKAWLRERTVEEVEDKLAALDRGPVRPLAQSDGPAPRDTPVPPKSVLVKRRPVGRPGSLRRYEHPCYWAGFILVGDPD